MDQNIKLPSNRSFGSVFFLVSFLFSLYPLINGKDILLWSLLVSIIILILGLINSKLLTPLNKIWFKFGILLGKIISPIIMSIIFFLVVTPIGFTMRLLGKDLLNLKNNKNKSYWIEKDGPKSNMKNQF